MTTEQEDKEFGAKIIGIASGVRRILLRGKQQIDDAVEASPYDCDEVGQLIDLADLLMQGRDKEYIIGCLQMHPDIVKRFDKMDLNW